MTPSELNLEIKTSLRLTIPLLTSLLSQTGIWIINSIVMGHLGPKELAAGGLAITGYFLVQVIFFGFINAAGICIGHAKGAKDSQAVISYLQHGIYLACILAIPMGLTLWYLPILLTYFDQPAELVELARQFLHGVAFGTVGILGFMMFRELCAHLELSKITMLISIAALPMSALLNYGLALGKLGFPSWGMFGIGMANSIVQWLMFISMITYTLFKAESRRYLYHQLKPMNRRDTQYLLYIGVPISLTYFFEAALISMSALMMGWVGTNALAAHQILLQCGETMFMCFFAIAQTLAVRAARCIGEKNKIGLQNTVLVNVSIGFLLACSVSLVYWFLPLQITQIFISTQQANQAILQLAQQFFHIASFFILFDALQIIGNNALRVMKDAYMPVLLNLGSYWLVGVGSAYLLGIVWHFGGQGIWFGLTLGVAAASMTTWSRWLWVHRRH